MSDTRGAAKMGSMPMPKLILSMSLPMMASMLVQALYNVVDSIFVAQISEDALAALSLAFPAQNIMIGISTGTAVGFGSLLSRALGAGDHKRANRVAGNAILLMVVSWCVVLLFGFFGSEAFIRTQTTSESIAQYGATYLRIVSCFSLGVYCEVGFNRLLMATGRTTLAMSVQMVGAVTNLILDPIMIFGYFGCPAMGVAGAAYATIIGQFVGAGVGIILNIRLNRDLRFSRGMFRPDLPLIRDIYQIGLPSILMVAIGSVMTFCMNKILIVFSSTAVAVFGAYFKLQSFFFMPVIGLNNGVIPIIAYNYGARDLSRIREATRCAIFFAFSIMVVACCIFSFLPHVLLSFFSPSQAMLDIGIPALRIIGLHYLLAGICIPISSSFQALGHAIYSFIVSAARQLVVLIPAAYLLSLTGRLELIWWSFPLAELMSLVVCVFFRKRLMRQVEQELAEPAAPEEIQA